MGLTVELSFYVCMLALWWLRWLGRIERVIAGWIALKWLWWLFPELPWRAYQILLVQHIPFFAIGMLAYRVWIGERSWIQQLPILAFGLVTVALVGESHFLYPYVFSSIMFALVSVGRATMLRTRLLLWLGAISYSLYLLHQTIGYAVLELLYRVGVGGWPSLIITTLGVLALSSLVTYGIERPAQKIIRAIWRARQKSRLTTQSSR